MLEIGSKTLTVDGITVYADHADPNQFWYLPGPVAMGRRRQDDKAALTFIKFKPAAVGDGSRGGGFLMFESTLELPRDLENRIRSRLSGIAPGIPRLSAAPFDEGTVECIALDLQGAGGTANQAPEGAFRAVEQILGASVPALDAANRAAFSLTLSQEGATILDKALRQGTEPVGVIYNLKYNALQPALDVKITADFKRIHDEFSASLSGSYYFMELGIDIALEKLKQSGAIKIEVIDFTGESDRADKENWALDFFKDTLLDDWFKPTLVPSPAQQAMAAAGAAGAGSPGGTTGGTGTGGTGTGGTGGTTSATTNRPAASGQTTAGGTGPSTGPGTGTGGTGTGASTSRPAAALTIESRQPNPSPAGFDLTHTPAPTGTSETVRVSGVGPGSTVKVEGQPVQPDASGNISVEVPAGASKSIEVVHPARPERTDTFNLFFDFEKPREAAFSSQPPSALYTSYLSGSPNPDDQRFRGTAPPQGSACADQSLRGKAAMENWAASCLASPKQVTVNGHASFESIRTDQKRSYNQRLSERRRQVAIGILGSSVQVTGGQAFGQARAEAANRVRVEEDRVTEISGVVEHGRSEIRIFGRLTRGAEPTTPPPIPPPIPPPTPPTPSTTPPGIPGAPKLAFKLKFVRREEQKTVTIHYNRRKAIRHTYAPQGFIGLLAQDLSQEDRHFVEVDLDDVFFRKFAVDVEAPIDFQRIGLTSAQVALDYGTPADAANHRHGDFVFDAEDRGPKRFEIFMNEGADTVYTQQTQFHFDPDSDWEGETFSIDLPPEETVDRTLLLNPHRRLGFLDIEVFPNDIDWGAVASIDVHLSYEDPGGWQTQNLLTFREETEAQHWKLRLTDKEAVEFRYRFVHHLKDGGMREGAEVVSAVPKVPVDDLFESALDLELVPLFDPASVRMVFVDIQYDDEVNDYHREERIRLAGESTEPVRQRIALVDPLQRSFRVRLTFVGTDNSMQRGAFEDTEETLIAVSEPAG